MHFFFLLFFFGVSVLLPIRGSGGGGWTSKTFEQVVEEEKAVLERAGIRPESTPADFAREYLSTRPNGYGGHRLVARGVVLGEKCVGGVLCMDGSGVGERWRLS